MSFIRDRSCKPVITDAFPSEDEIVDKTTNSGPNHFNKSFKV